MNLHNDFSDYTLLDTGLGTRLEVVGSYKIVRPDPQAIWARHFSDEVWMDVDAVFTRTSSEKGIWKKVKSTMPDSWTVRYNKLTLEARLTAYKHVGLFPEQEPQWQFISKEILQKEKPRMLNLFAYTGVASMVALASGAHVTHVDSSRPAISWAKENQRLSELGDKPIRWILEDVRKFVAREVRRGQKYDAIILDPPAYGHGVKGEPWDVYKDLPSLLQDCRKLLSDTPLFVMINAYAISASSLMLKNMLEDYFGDLGGSLESGELLLSEKNRNRSLSTGIYSIWKRV